MPSDRRKGGRGVSMDRIRPMPDAQSQPKQRELSSARWSSIQVARTRESLDVASSLTPRLQSSAALSKGPSELLEQDGSGLCSRDTAFECNFRARACDSRREPTARARAGRSVSGNEHVYPRWQAVN